MKGRGKQRKMSAQFRANGWTRLKRQFRSLGSTAAIAADRLRDAIRAAVQAIAKNQQERSSGPQLTLTAGPEQPKEPS